ncbi:MAG: TMEM165/GDT1 family protein [Bdellovibrionales bacterium]|nr:TMEM165/GDT1 family protein [Bdellovibrionales bacterium]
MESVFPSFLLVLASEMGDKTQLLALLLSARYHRPGPVMAGIFVATLINHSLAAWAGGWAGGLVPPDTLRWILALLFFVFAAWILVPDKDEDLSATSRGGAFLATAVAFFLAEMGDKTQIATVSLGARFQDTFSVTLGTTLGMLVADGLAVFWGDRLTKRIPMVWVRRGAAVLFLLFGVFILIGR